MYLPFLQITEEEFVNILTKHQVSPHVHDPSAVRPGEPLPDMSQWDRTLVDDVKVGGERDESGRIITYI